jgi:hypothetical protein
VGNLKALAKAMKAAGLYPPSTQIDTITKSLGELVNGAFAKNEWWRAAGPPVGPDAWNAS